VTGRAARALHGDLAQAERIEALAAFLSGLVPVLVATAVLARGLDLATIATVCAQALTRTTPESLSVPGGGVGGPV
jgi:superfamily II DNA/RNA helicase